jgi:outer membrane protein
MKRFLISSIFLLGVNWCSAQTLTLEQCVERAVQANISLQISALNIDLAKINHLQAWGGMLPNLNAQASHGYNWGQRIDQFTNQFATERIRSNNLGLSTNVNLFNGFSQYNTLKQAEINLDKSKLDYEKMRNDIALNVAAGYLAVLLSKEFEAIALSNRNNSLIQLERSEKLRSAGAIPESSLNDAKTQLASDESAYINAKNNTQLALLDLGQMMRLSSDEMKSFDVATGDQADELPMPITQTVEELVKSAMQTLPQIKSAALQVASAEKGVVIAKGAAMPSLSASASYGSGYSGAAQVLTGSPDLEAMPIGYVLGSNEIVVTPQYVYDDSDFSTKSFSDQLSDNVNRALFFTLTVPIFNGFGNTANIKRAEINLLNAALQEEQIEQSLVNEIQRAYANSSAAFAAYQAALTSSEAAKKSLDWVQLRYEQGLAQSIEFAAARTFYDNARANLARSKYDYIFKRRILDFYLGKSIVKQ